MIQQPTTWPYATARPDVELDTQSTDGIARLHVVGYGTVYGDEAAVREIERRLVAHEQQQRGAA